MRVLLTGGAGFIGRHVLHELLAHGHEVRVFDSLRPDVHGTDSPRSLEGAELHIADVRDASAVNKAVIGIDAVIHLAAKVGLGVDIYDLPDYAGSNEVGTAVLLAGMARAGVSRLTLASSMVVYGEGLAPCIEHGMVRPAPRSETALAAGQFEPPCPTCGRPLGHALVDESAPFDPRNAYASSKVAQEFYAGNWARLSGGSVTALRYHNVYGPGMPRDTPYAGVAAIFTSACGAERRHKYLRTGASAEISFMCATWPMRRSMLAKNKNPASRPSMSVQGRRAPSVRWRGVGRSAERARPEITGRYRLGDVRHITADSSRLRRELSWLPQVDFRQGMNELAHFKTPFALADKDFPNRCQLVSRG